MPVIPITVLRPVPTGASSRTWSWIKPPDSLEIKIRAIIDTLGKCRLAIFEKYADGLTAVSTHAPPSAGGWQYCRWTYPRWWSRLTRTRCNCRSYSTKRTRWWRAPTTLSHRMKIPCCFVAMSTGSKPATQTTLIFINYLLKQQYMLLCVTRYIAFLNGNR